MNITVTEYIKNLRIKKAKELILETDLSMLQISEMVGYEHNSSFTRVFKEIEGVSPVQFKRKSKNQLNIYWDIQIISYQKGLYYKIVIFYK